MVEVKDFICGRLTLLRSDCSYSFVVAGQRNAMVDNYFFTSICLDDFYRFNKGHPHTRTAEYWQSSKSRCHRADTDERRLGRSIWNDGTGFFNDTFVTVIFMAGKSFCSYIMIMQKEQKVRWPVGTPATAARRGWCPHQPQ